MCRNISLKMWSLIESGAACIQGPRTDSACLSNLTGKTCEQRAERNLERRFQALAAAVSSAGNMGLEQMPYTRL